MSDKERLERIKQDDLLRIINDISLYGPEGIRMELVIEDIEWLINRVEELETQLSINTNNMKHLQNKIERYKQALEFYADEKNHEREWDTFTDSGVEKSEVMKDGGEKARQALKGETK